MNAAQRIVLILAFLTVLGMALFPPWRAVIDSDDYTAGYHLIFWPAHSFSGHSSIRIDIARFAIQLVAIFAVTGVAYLILRPNRK